MGSDVARITYQPTRKYRDVMAQQGRVLIEADLNEAAAIVAEETRLKTLDIVGPTGTPDNGYAVSGGGTAASDFVVSPGTMYLGGIRTATSAQIVYSNQSEWLDCSGDALWADAQTPSTQKGALVYLLLREVEVSAVEDPTLREVALGGPDTGQRKRLLQRIARVPTTNLTCAAALADAVTFWGTQGLVYDGAQERLYSQTRLQVSPLQASTTASDCEPATSGGYLDADNQLIRVQVASAGNNPAVVWGFDNASFLYRVDMTQQITSTTDGGGNVLTTTLTLTASPPDIAHQPIQKQVVEILRAAASLGDSDAYVAAPVGTLASLASDYQSGGDTGGTVTITGGLPPEYLDATKTPALFVRIWTGTASLDPDTGPNSNLFKPMTLGDTNLQVTLTNAANVQLHVGDFWTFAVRPNLSDQAAGLAGEVFPARYLTDFQPPEGPRIWVTPLAVIDWPAANTFNLDEDCRTQFNDLVDLSKRRAQGCCTIVVTPADVAGGAGLEKLVFSYRGAGATICLAPGTYQLERTLALTKDDSGLTIESCQGPALLTGDNKQAPAFAQGLILVEAGANITLRGLHLQPVTAPTKTLGTLPTPALGVAIGVRALQTSDLLVEDCQIQLPGSLAQIGPTVIGVGILANGPTTGLTIRRCAVTGPAPPKRGNFVPFNAWFGIATTPVTIPTQKVATGPVGDSWPSSLVDVVLEENRFGDLDSAAFLYAASQRLSIRRNTTDGCTTGFSILDLKSFPILSAAVARGMVIPPAVAAILSPINDPVIWTASGILRLYPLPAGFKVQMISANAKASTSTGVLKSAQALIDRTQVALAAPKPRRQTATSGPGPAPAPGPGTGVGPGAARISGSAGSRLTTTGILAANTLASGIEANAFVGQVVGSGMALDFSENDVNLLRDFAVDGWCLLVWDDEASVGSSAAVNGNRMRSLSAKAVATIMTVDRCAIVGNLVTNESIEKSANPLSLVVVPGASPVGVNSEGVAITGNVLKGLEQLPARPSSVPLSVRNWSWFNAIIK